MIAAVLALAALAPQPPDPVTAARAWRRAHEHAIVEEFVQLLSIPNHGRNPPAIRRNADWIAAALRRRGVEPELFETRYAPPVVFGELRTPGAERTIVFYAHYDGQPTDPSQWTDDPFTPTLRAGSLEHGAERIAFPEPGTPYDPESRLYARSAGDDKAPIIATLTALDALRSAAIPLRSNVLFFFEGEEELGSAHLGRILEKYRDRLAADLWIFCDGPVHQNRQQQVVFGVRGVTGFDLTVYGSTRQLHSGHYGNWAPNPAMMLARLLASIKNDRDRVVVEGFYDQVEPLSAAEMQAIERAPRFDEQLKKELGLARTEGGGEPLDHLLNQPSLNVRGLASAGVGPLARNVIPSRAVASIDIRLVKGMDPNTTLDRVVAHIERQGYHVTADEPAAAVLRAHGKVARVVRRKGYRAMRTPMDLGIAQRAVRAVEAARGPVIVLPTLGGSLPLAVFEDVLQTPVVIVPIANHDNNQHAPDENLRIQNLWDGIETMASLLTMD